MCGWVGGEQIRVSYVNEVGAEEAGVDGGGLFKDFVENMSKAAFDVQYGLFRETSGRQLYPNPSSQLLLPNHLDYFRFVGQMLGKVRGGGGDGGGGGDDVWF